MSTDSRNWITTVADAVVDLGAITALGYYASTGTPEASIQVLAGAVVSVALGKRYLTRRG